MSKVIWAVQLVYHAVHAAGIVAKLDDLYGASSGLGAKFGDGPSVAFLRQSTVTAAVSDVVMMAALFFLGDSKLSFAIMAVSKLSFCMAAFHPDGWKTAFDWASALPELQEGLKHGALLAPAVVVLCIAGFALSSSKNDVKIVRSPSLFAAVLLKGIAAFEACFWVLLMTAPLNAFQLADLNGQLSGAGFTAAGMGMLNLVVSYAGSNIVAAHLVLMTLKPTRVACFVSVLFHALVVAGTFTTMQYVEALPNISNPGAKQMAAYVSGFARDAIAVHTVFAVLLLAAAAAASTPAGTKSKTV